ncbi:MAG TPA: alpha/beta fold hydrolase [Polyangiaceae bacterium LLY-WYZ-15_(1-7)]|nr:alpha/beta fold hydrolase [Polyangiaceae bacterium LLY-WYZ-15_(1-7)]HJL06677.1 alpha/beta fold hydrolase [Polyangiaceae bacterium LLY-WYZ-15_(1-7)]HJL07317.1 alpha/beta fold hydrolase [Polyangiaceae bacterium LLY-WYZ-15_(1-7)]HJL30348.1 alpha/beta fold hydrolase [Polyangiaceae bacterium LLY-WYZ-15_(1-7)]HJL39264.1 alpha/beta fold hydrolase [Polyangiaceae bacterium LLY-WYZ-15_(1-7)]
MVFLPGNGDTAEDYVANGFVAELERARVRADVVAADATRAYYASGAVERRVREDVLAPARAQGYAQLWLVGISMGGGGALRVAASAPELVDGVVVFAPFMGSPGLFREVKAAGGPAAWSPSAERRAERDPYVDAWHWAGHRAGTPLFVGWGSADPLARFAEVLAEDLPESHVVAGGGGHSWDVWDELWRGFVTAGHLQRACGVR